MSRADGPVAKPPPIEAAYSTTSVWPYVLPMAIFLLMTSLEGSILPSDARGRVDPGWYFGYYALKILAVVIALLVSRATFRDLRPLPSPQALTAAVAIGIWVTVAWIALERLPYPHIALSGTRVGFNPGALDPSRRGIFLALRFLGLVAVVPVMEELFWRSFLLRWIIDQDFWKVPIGRVTVAAAAGTSALFAAAHPEWLPALLVGLAWAGLLAWSRSLSACVVSHAVANLALGIHVLRTGAWQLW